MITKGNKKSTKVQVVMLEIDKFNGLKDAIKWIEKNSFSAKKVDITDRYYRFRQQPPNKFKKGSLRTKALSSRVKIVIGIPK